MRHEIRFSGFGGQGIILSAVILGRAAALYDNNYAVQTQVYGPEARGGASMSAVIISDEPILYPSEAKTTLKRVIVANIVMLGALVAITGVVSREAIEKAVLDSVPRGTEELNMKALRRGFELGEKEVETQ